MADALSERVTIARYSLLKVIGWAILFAGAAIWIIADEEASGWRLPAGPHGLMLALAPAAAVCALVYSTALVINLAVSQGVVIAVDGRDLVLCYPFGWKRIVLDSHLKAYVTNYTPTASSYLGLASLKMPAIPQVTISRDGYPDVFVRTALLTESADKIAARIADLVR